MTAIEAFLSLNGRFRLLTLVGDWIFHAWNYAKHAYVAPLLPGYKRSICIREPIMRISARPLWRGLGAALLLSAAGTATAANHIYVPFTLLNGAQTQASDMWL